MNPAIYIAGTDTGVGKTHVTVALCRALRARGLTVGVFKPAETGCEPGKDGERIAADAVALLEASGSSAPMNRVCPYRLRDPLAPAVAAKREGIEIDPEQLDLNLATLRASHDVVLCEGAGGIYTKEQNLASGSVIMRSLAEYYSGARR
jgi:dethiobiotin synthetase